MLHLFKLTLPLSYTGKTPVTPLAEPPTFEKDLQNKTEQLGELLLWSYFLSCPPVPVLHNILTCSQVVTEI